MTIYLKSHHKIKVPKDNEQYYYIPEVDMNDVYVYRVGITDATRKLIYIIPYDNVAYIDKRTQ